MANKIFFFIFAIAVCESACGVHVQLTTVQPAVLHFSADLEEANALKHGSNSYIVVGAFQLSPEQIAQGHQPLPVAIKIEKFDTKHREDDNFDKEIEVYDHIEKYRRDGKLLMGIPQYYGWGNTRDAGGRQVRFIAIQLLAPMSNINKPSIFMMAYQVVTILEVLYTIGVVVRDLNENDIMVGATFDTSSTIFITDYGAAMLFVSSTSIDEDEDQSPVLVGDPHYRSLQAHTTKYISHGAPIESLIFVVCKLLLNQSPWHSAVKEKQTEQELIAALKTIKRQPNFHDILKDHNFGIPDAFQTMLDHARRLSHDVKPCYDLVRGLFNYMLLLTENFDGNTMFSWVNDHIREHKPQMSEEIKSNHLKINPLSTLNEEYEISRTEHIWDLRPTSGKKTSDKRKSTAASSSPKGKIQKVAESSSSSKR